MEEITVNDDNMIKREGYGRLPTQDTRYLSWSKEWREEAEKIKGLRIQGKDCEEGIDNTILAIEMYIQDSCFSAAD